MKTILFIGLIICLVSVWFAEMKRATDDEK